MYALMDRRTKVAYAALFAYVELNVAQLAPKQFMTDFETPLRQGIRQIYPGAETKGCWFHFKQANIRKSATFPELLEELRKPDSQRIFQKFLALPLLPAAKILEGFRLVKAEALAKDSAAFGRFVDYHERQWIRKV